MRKEKSCGCIVYNDQMQVLLVQMQQGHWSFPKGHVEEGETEVETAMRETFEETHIKIDVDQGFRMVSTYSPMPNVLKDVIFFVGKALTQDIQIQIEEVQSAGFYSADEAAKRITFNADLAIYQASLTYMKEQNAG